MKITRPPKKRLLIQRASKAKAKVLLKKIEEEEQESNHIGKPVQTERGIIYLIGGCMVSPPASCPHAVKVKGSRQADIAICQHFCQSQCAKYGFLLKTFDFKKAR